MLPSLGEEIGWRGYLLGRWRLLGPWRASLAVAGVWAAWHAPLFAVYIAKDDMAAETALASTVSLVCGGALLGMLTLRFDSLWPAVFGHALMNSLLVWGYGLVQPAPEDLDPARFWGFNAIGWVLLILATAVVRIGLRRSTSRSL
jgi:membrane protease YdiL (CAAX protease family)